MRINEIIYYSTSLRLENLDLDNKALVLQCFEERTIDYYIKPIRLLADQKMAFAAGALECLLIDALARYATLENGSESRMVDWFQEHLQLSKSAATNFYKFFRCGLLHEGHIKQFGQFCFDDIFGEEPVIEIDSYLIVHPGLLCRSLEVYLQKFLLKLQTDAGLYRIFIRRMRQDFEEEIRQAQI